MDSRRPDPQGIPGLKVTLRRELRRQWRALAPGLRGEASTAAVRQLLGRPEWQAARRVLLYAPLADELDLTALAGPGRKEDRLVALPRFDAARGEYGAAVVVDLGRDLVPGQFGVPEPGAHCPEVPLNQLDFALVPGLGFDHEGRRLGRGRGFYDRLLSALHGTACGVAMDWQVLGSIPAEPHDQAVDYILTPTRWLAVARRFADP